MGKSAPQRSLMPVRMSSSSLARLTCVPPYSSVRRFQNGERKLWMMWLLPALMSMPS